MSLKAIPKILVTGKNGQVGFELQRSLAILGEVIAVDRNDCDLSNPAAICELVQRIRPDIIVNPAAHTAVDKAESEVELATLLNVTAPQVFAEEAAKLGALLVHYSTDYVFDGTKDGEYLESDATNPQSVYGKTKLAGELAVAAANPRHLIFRTSWVFGAHGGNFLKTMLRLMQQRDTLSVVADQIGAPTSASMIADATAQIIAQYLRSADQAQFAFGTYNLVADGETSWHGYASLINDIAVAQGYTLKIRGSDIKPIPASDYPVPAPRPANSRLNTQKLETTFGLVLPEWQAGVHNVMTLLKQV
ncbi:MULTISPECIES: dTDP-4-dehydrorhamnose reductase [Deefgea]|uniref:dTDP-4-dehydrorhamnose reductase n=1 Tax=Deefgea chitinilytica TaxID=570276 RepID=A0ABS2C778_9NEIS|nr:MULTISPECIES: dTDP-4-dehydrorhamnose reductase [Deefgea]MBM5570011.1 dTDP-4-dehydrorhamnose reductase [Deefgea chitinilytica]MBM9887240.1 dTDP-4-dehydrorhamnose reductase [Deefgea sp. CFH1-16]